MSPWLELGTCCSRESPAREQKLLGWGNHIQQQPSTHREAMAPRAQPRTPQDNRTPRDRGLCHSSASSHVKQQQAEQSWGQSQPRATLGRGSVGKSSPGQPLPAPQWPPAKHRGMCCQQHPVPQAPAIDSMTSDKNNSRNSKAAWQDPSSQAGGHRATPLGLSGLVASDCTARGAPSSAGHP